MHKVYVLLSGGIDSTTTLAMAMEDFGRVADYEAVTIDYGQRHVKEMESAKAVCNFYGVNHVVIDAKGFMTGMLVAKPQNEVIPDVSYADLPEGISPTYVSFRNGLMLSILTARAQGWVMAQQKAYEELIRGKTFDANSVHPKFEATIYCGVHADDGANWAYPDCSPEFIGGMANAIFVGSYQTVRLRTPLLYMSKAEVVRVGDRLGVPYVDTWSCYKGEELHCGVCPTCRSRREAFQFLGINDPTEYAQ